MEKIVIFNANNESMQVDVVRYFGDSNNRYFIFSLHELDAQGHMNIYVTKIIDQNGVLVGTNIIDDVEWTNLKNNLQRIIKENRTSGKALVNDLPFSNLQNIKVADRRALKLLASSVDMLNLGYNMSNTQQSNETQNTQSFAQSNVQNTVENVQPQQDNMNVFNSFPQQNVEKTDINNYQQPVQQSPQPTPVMPQSTQKPVNNSISDNYKDLYFNEKAKADKLASENNQLVNELNNYKMMISDIKNILSRP